MAIIGVAGKRKQTVVAGVPCCHAVSWAVGLASHLWQTKRAAGRISPTLVRACRTHAPVFVLHRWPLLQQAVKLPMQPLQHVVQHPLHVHHALCARERCMAGRRDYAQCSRQRLRRQLRRHRLAHRGALPRGSAAAVLHRLRMASGLARAETRSGVEKLRCSVCRATWPPCAVLHSASF